MKKNAAAVLLGRLGGRARAKALSPAERRAIALNAIRTRWRRHRALQAAGKKP
jgi:hypothetical protein